MEIEDRFARIIPNQGVYQMILMHPSKGDVRCTTMPQLIYFHCTGLFWAHCCIFLLTSESLKNMPRNLLSFPRDYSVTADLKAVG